ncbi:kinase-like domain-containing protein [Lasiosphaeris hirsuta]|uniref:Kinase-like domain-containing protein n=1 Tax=Lasiosphaeris hirsuta TaxID=260670 RepID=A0AA40AI68_9PEZI|nr:kinase-like domain-containing protein [Lasiosphaeris hirsuta]
MRRDHVGDSYKLALLQMNYELQLMSKPSLYRHRNITKLLAVCFDHGDPSSAEAPTAVVRPGLLVELAHEQYPDLRCFFDPGANPSRPSHLPFEKSASIVADIADGITALHDHDIVHSDLKPENVLLFADAQSPANVTAKIADFGYVGMTTYTKSGVRSPFADSRPRGFTPEWSAPECLQHPDYYKESGSLDHATYQPCADIYSFGLLSCYVALDGQTPLEYAPNLSKSKTSDSLLDIAVAKLREHYRQGMIGRGGSFEEVAIRIAHETLRLDPEARLQSLRSIRPMLFGTEAPPKANDKFVISFNLFPDSAHEFKCQGLFAAYWSSPPGFRANVLESFRRLSSGPFGQHVAPEIWACLTEEPKI